MHKFLLSLVALTALSQAPCLACKRSLDEEISKDGIKRPKISHQHSLDEEVGKNKVEKQKFFLQPSYQEKRTLADYIYPNYLVSGVSPTSSYHMPLDSSNLSERNRNSNSVMKFTVKF